MENVQGFHGSAEFRLHGHPSDLEEVRIALHQNTPKVVNYGEEYFLQIPGFEGDIVEIRRFAREYLLQLNGAASLILPGGFQPLSLGADEWYWLDSHGHRSRGAGGKEFISASSFRGGRLMDDDFQIKIRMTLSIILSQCTTGVRKEDLKLRHILQIMSKSNPTWSELYLAQELAWGYKEFEGIDEGETDKIKIFKKTAHSWTAIGVQARHGNKPAQKDITLDEAMSYNDALKLVRSYIKELLDHIGRSDKHKHS